MSKNQKTMAASSGGVSTATETPEESRAYEPVAESEIAIRAYSFWEARGFEGGSADEDWYRAIEELDEERRAQSSSETELTRLLAATAQSR
jgi:hypothetical protein